MIGRILKSLAHRADKAGGRGRESGVVDRRIPPFRPDVTAERDIRWSGLPALKTFTDESGLPQNTVVDIEFDADGYLWVATEDGAARYNGRSWTPTAMPNRTVSNQMRCLKATVDGAVWFGTHGGGLARLVDGEWTVFDVTSGLPDSIVLCIEEEVHADGNSSLWVGTRRGLARYRNGAWETWGERDGLPSAIVTSLRVAERSAGGHALWVGTRRGVVGLDTRRPERLLAVPGIPEATIRALHVDENAGVLWVATKGAGLCRYDGRSCESFDSANGFPSDDVFALAESRTATGEGILWAGTSAGLVRFDGARVETLTRRSGLPSDVVLSVRPGPAGAGDQTIWIGSDGGGLTRIAASQWTAFTSGSCLPHDTIESILETRGDDGRVATWFATDGGVAVHEHGAWSSVTSEPNAPSGPAWCLGATKAPTRRLLVGTAKFGLAVRSEDGWHFHDKRSGLASDFVTSIATSDGPQGDRIWVGTDAGLAHYDGAAWRNLGTNDGLPHHYVGSVAVTRRQPDGHDVLWVGTGGGGLARFERGARTVLNVAAGFPNDTVLCISEILATDGRRELWVGTQSAGVAIIELDGDELSWQVISDETVPALPNNTVNQVQADRFGRVYVFTNKGVARLTPRVPTRTDRSSYSVYTFTTEDGLPSNECNVGAAMVDSLGRVWAGTVRGAAMLDPTVEIADDRPKPLHISCVEVGGARVSPARVGTLKHDRNNLTFEVDLLSYFREEDTRYRTQLVGFDPASSDWTPDWRRTYTNLPAGDYRFKVWGRDYAGNVSGPETVSFRIKSAPWRTWWAYAGYGALAAGAAVGGVRWRVNTLRRRTEELEATVRMQTATLADQLDLLGRSEAIARERAEELALVVDQLRAAEARAQAMRREAVAAKDKAIEASHAKSVFLSNMSHELRTPLNAVLGFAQLMDRDSGLSFDQREHLAAIMSSGEHLLHLINDVLSLSKIEAGKLALAVGPFDLVRTLEGVEAMLRGRTRAKGLEFVVERAAGLPRWVRGDEGKLRQVLINLLGNAVKFTADGNVTLRARWRGGIAEFEVSDTGHGISVAELDELFEPFVQTESGLRSKEGTGLGLAISRNFVRMMGGDVRVSSRLGEGSVFTFDVELPEVVDAGERAGRRSVLALEPDQPEYRILIVDDADRNREILNKLLTSIGFSVSEAADGREAVAVWASWRPDLILMDMRMPVLDGRAATMEIRRIEASTSGAALVEEQRPTKIISLTASAFEHERTEILQAGCDDFLTKPFREDLLFQKLAKHLGARFRYAPESGPSAEDPDADRRGPLEPGRLRDLPIEWLASLNDAVVKGDIEQVNLVVDEIATRDADLADELRELIRTYRFDDIQDLIANVPA